MASASPSSKGSIASVVLFRIPLGLPEGLLLFPVLKAISQSFIVSTLANAREETVRGTAWRHEATLALRHTF